MADQSYKKQHVFPYFIDLQVKVGGAIECIAKEETPANTPPITERKRKLYKGDSHGSRG